MAEVVKNKPPGADSRNSENENKEAFGDISIEDISEAEKFIREAFEKGERPVVTVPREYADALANGLRPHATWIPWFQMIVGTLGRTPYHLEGRIVVRITNISTDRIRPRFTGPDKKFHGVVAIDGPIAPDAIEIYR